MRVNCAHPERCGSRGRWRWSLWSMKSVLRPSIDTGCKGVYWGFGKGGDESCHAERSCRRGCSLKTSGSSRSDTRRRQIRISRRRVARAAASHRPSLRRCCFAATPCIFAAQQCGDPQLLHKRIWRHCNRGARIDRPCCTAVWRPAFVLLDQTDPRGPMHRLLKRRACSSNLCLHELVYNRVCIADRSRSNVGVRDLAEDSNKAADHCQGVLLSSRSLILHAMQRGLRVWLPVQAHGGPEPAPHRLYACHLQVVSTC